LTIEHERIRRRPQKPSASRRKKPVREASGSARRGAIEIQPTKWRCVSVDADVDEAALRLVALRHEGGVMLQVAPGVRVYLAWPAVDMRKA